MKLSIIVPVYNSENILHELVKRISDSLKNTILHNQFEIIMINDFSQDNSWEGIKSLSTKNNFIKGINLARNFGQHNAIIAGFNFCSGKRVVTIDDDLQHPPEFIFNLYIKLDECEVCYTYYKNRRHIKWKKAVSSINNIVSSFLLNKPFHIYLSSFRGLKKSVIDNVIKFKGSDVYIDSLILSSTKEIKMITVDHSERFEGVSNYNFKKLLILWSNMVLNFSFKPFRLSSIFGSILKLSIKIFRKSNSLKNQYIISSKTFKD